MTFRQYLELLVHVIITSLIILTPITEEFNIEGGIAA